MCENANNRPLPIAHAPRTSSPRIPAREEFLSQAAHHAMHCSNMLSAESQRVWTSGHVWDSKLLVVARLPDEEWRRPPKTQVTVRCIQKAFVTTRQNRKCLQSQHKLQIRVSCPAAKSLAVTTATSTMTPIRLTAEWPPRGQTSPSRQLCSPELRPKQVCSPTSACVRSCWA